MNVASIIFEQEFPVHSHSLDKYGNITLTTLLNYFQDAAVKHAELLGVSIAELREQELTWVLSRIHVVIKRYPRAGETMLIRTWPSTLGGIFCCREFEILDNSGAIAGCATTSWAVLNTKTRRPVKLENHLRPFPMLPRRAINDNFTTLPELPENGEMSELSFRVLRSDLDSNNHVNNAIYAGWALEAVPDNIAVKRLTELEISFRAETFYGESIISRCVVTETDFASCCLHRITSRGDGRELARLRTRWQDRDNVKQGEKIDEC